MNQEQARLQMVEQQIRGWEVLDLRVLEVLREVRRELFVPSAYRQLAFGDMPIPLDHGQCMLTPKVDGRILQALELKAGEEVLEVGTGSGFLAACLSRLGARVRSIDIVPELTARAGENLRAAGIGGITLGTQDAFTLTDESRYDAIALTGSLPVYDPRFERSLKVGGRLFLVLGQAPVMEALLVRRTTQDQWTRESLFETVIPPLINAPQPPKFIF